jgi:BirA family biotin operon repressor/biotin-[acetyl-CoA-carboxylase] ligase
MDDNAPPLPAAALRAALAGSALVAGIEVVASTGSTNADLLAAAARGAPSGSVLVAGQQTAGRGRLGRAWQSEPGTALTFSVLLRPDKVPPARRGWLPLLAGVAAVTAIRAQTGVPASLKWPNDVLAPGGKLAGILAEQSAAAIVTGIGLNVTASPAGLPPGQATSLKAAGGRNLDCQHLLVAILTELEHWYRAWADGTAPGDAEACGLRAAYTGACSTLGRQVRVELPGGSVLTGTAEGIDEAGCLRVAEGGEVTAVSAGDVVHVR